MYSPLLFIIYLRPSFGACAPPSPDLTFSAYALLRRVGRLSFVSCYLCLFLVSLRPSFVGCAATFSRFNFLCLYFLRRVRRLSALCQPRIVRIPPKRRYFRALCRIRLSPYIQYEQSRLRQKSSKIATFWLPASIAARF